MKTDAMFSGIVIIYLITICSGPGPDAGQSCRHNSMRSMIIHSPKKRDQRIMARIHMLPQIYFRHVMSCAYMPPGGKGLIVFAYQYGLFWDPKINHHDLPWPIRVISMTVILMQRLVLGNTFLSAVHHYITIQNGRK